MRGEDVGAIAVSLAVAWAGAGTAGAQDKPSARQADASRGVPVEWLSPVERTGFQQTPRYEETVAFCRRLASASEWITYRSFGTSPEGRELPLVIASKSGAFTPQAARTAGRLVVLIQNAIHAGECAGKDASLMLLRDLAVTRSRAALLEHVVLLVVPIFNVDGHERFSPHSRINQKGPEAMGWRVTSRNLNLNRDYMKADTVEMRAWLALWNAWQPDLHIDTHTTDGGDWQYDVTYGAETYQTADGEVAAWLTDILLPDLAAGLRDDGHASMTYFNLLDSKDPAKGIRSGPLGPRFSTGYVAIRNRPSILVETHVHKPYRTRVLAQYSLIRHALETLNRDPESLIEAVRAADQATVRMGSNDPSAFRLPLRLEGTDESVPLTLKSYAYRRELSAVSGAVRIIYDEHVPTDIETTWYNRTKVTREVTPPRAYVIPPQWTEVIGVLQAHGVRCERLIEPVTAEFESYRFEDVTFRKRPYESRLLPEYTTKPVTERRTLPAGSVVVPLDQPTAKVAIHLLEPEAPDSLVAWGFFNAIFEQKEYAEHYVLEELARKMLAADPELRKRFESRIHEDRDFAADPWARLYFFYRRSPYWDDRMNAYPVVRTTNPLSARTKPLAR